MKTLFFLLFFCSPSFAEIINYFDDDGVLNIVSDEVYLPEKQKQQYREKFKKITKVYFDKNRILVPVKLTHLQNSIDTIFLLDTGPSNSVIEDDLAIQLGIIDTAKPSNMIVADGSTVNVLSSFIQKIEIGNRFVINNSVLIHTSKTSVKYKGILGMTFLSNFKYSIDYKNSQIIWH